MKLGSWLIARGRISGVQLKRALLDQSFYGGYLSTSLMKLEYLDERTLGDYLSEVFQVPYAPAAKLESVPPEILRTVPAQVAERHQILPIGLEGKRLQLAMMNPRDIRILDEVAFLTGLSVDPWVASEDHLLGALERYYGIPRPVRATIPLADRIEELPETPVRPFSPAAALEPAPEFESVSPTEVGEDFSPRTEESTLSPPSAGADPFPRNILEWREMAEASDGGGSSTTDGSVTVSSTAPPSPYPPRPPQLADPGSQPEPAPTSPALRAPLTLVPNRAPTSVEEVTQRLRSSDSKEEIFEALLGFCALRFLRTALFLVQQDQVVGWGGQGEGLDPVRLRRTVVPFNVPSIFSYFRMGSDFYFGPVPGLPANRKFYQDLGVEFPDRILLVPIPVKERLIALLYGDNGSGRKEEPEISTYRRLAQKVSLALEVLILRNKIGTL